MATPVSPMMKTPREIVLNWVSAFNAADSQTLSTLYHHDAVNHQVAAGDPVCGKKAICAMFDREFAAARALPGGRMECIVENVFSDGEWGILEWRDPAGLRGCGFFQMKDNLIVFQRGYWDRLSFERLHGVAAPTA